MENKRVEDERRHEQNELSMMQAKPKISTQKGSNYKLANQLYIDNVKRNLEGKAMVKIHDNTQDEINVSNALTLEDPNKIARGILNSIIKEVPFISKNNYNMYKKKEQLDK